jgi:hypothetical protein
VPGRHIFINIHWFQFDDFIIIMGEENLPDLVLIPLLEPLMNNSLTFLHLVRVFTLVIVIGVLLGIQLYLFFENKQESCSSLY